MIGISLTIQPDAKGVPIDIDRAPNLNGAPDLSLVERVATIPPEGVFGTGVTFVDELPNDGQTRWYRARHDPVDQEPGPWWPWVSGVPREIASRDENGAEAGLTAMRALLDQKSDKGHTHPQSEVQGLPAALAARPTLDANGKLSASVIPSLAIDERFTASSETAMLALTAEVGDFCVRTDTDPALNGAVFVLAGGDPTVLGNWLRLNGGAGITSVNGKTGPAVTLVPGDIGAAAASHTHAVATSTTDGFMSAAQAAQLASLAAGGSSGTSSAGTSTVTVLRGRGRHGEIVTFPQAFARPPLVRVFGGVNHQPESRWGAADGAGTSAPSAALAQYDASDAVGVSTTGFTLRALLWQKVSSGRTSASNVWFARATFDYTQAQYRAGNVGVVAGLTDSGGGTRAFRITYTDSGSEGSPATGGSGTPTVDYTQEQYRVGTPTITGGQADVGGGTRAFVGTNLSGFANAWNPLGSAGAMPASFVTLLRAGAQLRVWFLVVEGGSIRGGNQLGFSAENAQPTVTNTTGTSGAFTITSVGNGWFRIQFDYFALPANAQLRIYTVDFATGPLFFQHPSDTNAPGGGSPAVPPVVPNDQLLFRGGAATQASPYTVELHSRAVGAGRALVRVGPVGDTTNEATVSLTWAAANGAPTVGTPWNRGGVTISAGAPVSLGNGWHRITLTLGGTTVTGGTPVRLALWSLQAGTSFDIQHPSDTTTAPAPPAPLTAAGSASTAQTLTSAEIGRVTVRYGGTLTAQVAATGADTATSVRALVAVESSPDGTTWTARAVREHRVTKSARAGAAATLALSEAVPVALPTADTRVRIRLTTLELTGNPDASTGASIMPERADYVTVGAGDTYASRTPLTTDQVEWEAWLV